MAGVEDVMLEEKLSEAIVAELKRQAPNRQSVPISASR
jgi:hypothetical protein